MRGGGTAHAWALKADALTESVEPRNRREDKTRASQIRQYALRTLRRVHFWKQISISERTQVRRSDPLESAAIYCYITHVLAIIHELKHDENISRPVGMKSEFVTSYKVFLDYPFHATVNRAKNFHCLVLPQTIKIGSR